MREFAFSVVGGGLWKASYVGGFIALDDMG